MNWFFVLGNAGFLARLALTALPQAQKRRPPLDQWMTPRLHLVSGLVEAAGGTLLFVEASLAWMQGHPIGPRWLNLLPSDAPAEVPVGPWGFYSFLVTPLAWLCLYAMVEGVGRTLEAYFFNSMPGMALVVVPLRLAEKLLSHLREGRELLGAQLAPPDRVDCFADAGEERCELVSFRRYPWEPGMTVSIQGKLWVLEVVEPLAPGAGHRYRYRLRALWPGEIIRGSVHFWDGGGEPQRSSGV